MNCCYTEDIRLTSWGWYFFPSIHRVVYIAGGAGFLPLTLSWTIICGLWCWRWILLTHRFLYFSLCFHPSVRLTKNNSAKSKRRCEEIQFKDSSVLTTNRIPLQQILWDATSKICHFCHGQWHGYEIEMSTKVINHDLSVVRVFWTGQRIFSCSMVVYQENICLISSSGEVLLF